MSVELSGFYQQYILPWALKIVAALLIFMIGKWVARLISVLVGRAMTTAKVSPSLVTFSSHVTYYALWIMVAIAALNKLGVETTSFVALVGAAGLAVGLALQGALSNFAAGVMVLIFQPFGIGDEIEAGGTIGIVTEIQMFNTVFQTADGKTVIVPNAKITADKITINKKA
ncbi:MAG: mechanosensitive ion channel [Candidatus Omnitrophica bacterium]|nr:mechanosensitive ion channel [Candidatus Omnitrophota bacterium]